MATNDTCCTIVPYFQVQDGHLDEFKALCERFVAKTGEEPDCLYYGFCFDDHIAHCREGYVNAAGLLAHLDNVGALLEEAFKIAEITRLEVHGPEVRAGRSFASRSRALNPQFFTLEYGFRR